jgi:sugar lactone lactonase YvrE
MFSFAEDGLDHLRTVESERLCRANDVAVASDGRIFASRDHGACGGLGAWLEDLLDLARSEVIELGPIGADGLTTAAPAAVVEGLAFANGLVVDRGTGTLYVAESRGKAIKTYALASLDRERPRREADRRIALDEAGPDNLTLSANGALLAAAHPSLIGFALYRYRLFGEDRVPSMVFSIDLSSGEAAAIYDEPEGDLLPGATVALRFGDALLLGAAFADGIAICRGPGEEGAGASTAAAGPR